VIEKINTDQIEQWISNENDEMKDLMVNCIMSVSAGSIRLLAAATLIFCLLNLKCQNSKMINKFDISLQCTKNLQIKKNV
jgi:hypothetical protein